MNNLINKAMSFLVILLSFVPTYWMFGLIFSIPYSFAKFDYSTTIFVLRFWETPANDLVFWMRLIGFSFALVIFIGALKSSFSKK